MTYFRFGMITDININLFPIAFVFAYLMAGSANRSVGSRNLKLNNLKKVSERTLNCIRIISS
jgi:hypothetical protein